MHVAADITQRNSPPLVMPPTAEMLPLGDHAAIKVRQLTPNDDLRSVLPAWRELMNRAVCLNPCFPPDFLLPLCQHLPEPSLSVLIATTKPDFSDKQSLIGLMPIVDETIYRLPVKAVQVWRPDMAFDGTPILDHDQSSVALTAMLSWLADQGVKLVGLDTASAHPKIQKAIDDAAENLNGSIFQRDRFERAALRPERETRQYLQKHVSKNRRKKARQQLKRLAAIGEVCFELCDDPKDMPTCLQQFMKIEAAGWKGNGGTALASENETRAFTIDLADRFAAAASIRFARLLLDGQPIAMLMDLTLNGSVFAYKTTYDETYREYSPGFLLELENIRWLHENPCSIADACTAPDNELINSLYNQRLPFQNTVIGLGRSSKFWVHQIMPMLQSAARTVRTWRG